MTVRIIRPDDSEALLLVEACDGVAAEPPRVAPLLQGGVVGISLSLQMLGQEPMLSSERASARKEEIFK